MSVQQQIYYKGNMNLRAEGVEYVYTDEQLEELRRCATDVMYFVKTYCKIISLDDGLVNFDLYDFQEQMIDEMHNSTRLIIKLPRQCGKTTTTAAYLCHFILFNDEKTTAILANKGSAAREVLDRIKLMYEHLPFWMQQGVVEWNKGRIALENYSKIITGATSSSAIRGQSINVLYMDEFAFIPPGVFEEFITSVYPTVASSRNAKIIMSSTPFGMNHFYKMWTEAVEGHNGYSYFEVAWNDIPGRDDEYRDRTISEIGQERWEQEYEAEFMGSSGTLINGQTLKNLAFRRPVAVEHDGRFNVYYPPQQNNLYALFCDVAEGVGGDSSTIQVIDVTESPYKQVATYEDNTIKTNVFHHVISRIGSYYNDALVVVESNSMGGEVNDLLNFDSEYENIFYLNKDFGLKTTKLTKRKGCAQLKHLIERGLLEVVDVNTIIQLSKFIKKRNNTYSADDGEHDDLVMPLVSFAFFMSQNQFVENWLDVEDVTSKLQKEKIKAIEDELLPVGFIDDGIVLVDFENGPIE